MKPSFNAFVETINSNKISFILIFFFNIIKAFCENCLIIFTFYLLTFLQNGEINESEITFPIGESFFSFLREIEIPININYILILMIAVAFIQSLCQYIGRLNIELMGAWLREKIYRY